MDLCTPNNNFKPVQNYRSAPYFISIPSIKRKRIIDEDILLKQIVDTDTHLEQVIDDNIHQMNIKILKEHTYCTEALAIATLKKYNGNVIESILDIMRSIGL